MRTGAAAGHDGYLHEAVYYASDEEFLAVAVPFLLDGVAAGEPAVAALGPAHAALLRDATGGDESIRYLADVYAGPAGAIRSYRHLLGDLVAGGAAQIRIIGELAPSAFGPTWDWWARYESAINHAYDDFPLWSMCAYHTEATPRRVLDEVARTHPWVVTPAGTHEPSTPYTDPVAFLGERRPAVPDPIQAGRPAVELTDPMPADARRAVLAAAPTAFDGRTVDDFVTAASEAVTNAIRHGRPPVVARLWTAADRLVLTVTDAGTGPLDPYAGLLPDPDRAQPGGLGLWLTHQMCGHVSLDRHDDGFTIRLTAGVPYAGDA